jgi:hypothetical protein
LERILDAEEGAEEVFVVVVLAAEQELFKILECSLFCK